VEVVTGRISAVVVVVASSVDVVSGILVVLVIISCSVDVISGCCVVVITTVSVGVDSGTGVVVSGAPMEVVTGRISAVVVVLASSVDVVSVVDLRVVVIEHSSSVFTLVTQRVRIWYRVSFWHRQFSQSFRYSHWLSSL
jgi:hypothetical protein